MVTLFISDLHLDESRPAVTHALFDFLHCIAGQCHALYILGDLFESWIGDDDDAPLCDHVRLALRALSATGPRVYFMHGNRDFLVGEEFCRRSGVILLPEPTCIDLCGEKTILLHGDSLCTKDTDYQSFRARVRDQDFQAEILAQPLQQRRELATQLRDMSADATSNKAADIMDVTPEEVVDMMHQHGAGRLIHGHTHRPARHQVALDNRTGERIVQIGRAHV